MNSTWDDICNVIYKHKNKYLLSSLKIAIYYYSKNSLKIGILHIVKYFILVFCRLSKYKIQKDRYDIVFFLQANTPSNVDNLIPIVKASIAAGKNILLILGENFDGKNPLSDYQCCKCLNINKLYGNIKLYSKIINLFVAASLLFDAHKAYKDISVVSISIRRNILGYYYHIYLTLIYRQIFDLLFSKISTRYSISTSDFWPPENQFVQTAIKHGYNTYVIQHGVISEYWWPFDAGYYLVWGELHKDQLVKLGVPEGNIIVVGMPALDKNVNINTDYKINNFTKKKILIISQTQTPSFSENIYIKYASILKVLIEMDDDYIITVKLHPNEEMTFYDKYGFSNLKKFNFIKHERPIHEMIIESDLCITFFSTGGLEAIALNRALAVMNLESWMEDLAWWPKYGGGLYIPDDISLRELLIKISKDAQYINILIENQKIFMRKSFSNYGNASNAIIEKLSSNTNIALLSS